MKTSQLKNLRSHPELRPVGIPSTICYGGSVKPLGYIGSELILSSGKSIGRAFNRQFISEIELDAAPLCALNISSSILMIMTSAGNLKLSIDDERELSITNIPSSYPAVVLRAKNGGTYSTSVPQRTLSKEYSSGLLSISDSKAVVSDLEYAYATLVDRASQAGSFLQPALGRCKYYDLDGNLLHVTPPVLLRTTDAPVLSTSIQLTSSTASTIDAYTIEAPSWLPEITIPDLDEMQLAGVYRIEACLSPQFHPYDSSEKAIPINMTRGGTSSTSYVTVALPGARNGLKESTAAASANKLRSAVGAVDSLERVSLTLTSPFSENSFIGTNPFADSLSSESKLMPSILKKDITRYERESVLLSSPHTFYANIVAKDGNAVIWGAPSLKRFPGFSILNFAAATTSADAECDICVEMSDGTIVKHSESLTLVPTLFNPILSYPAPDAIKMTILITDDYGSHLGIFDLSPDTSGRHSLYIHPTLAPFELEEGTTTLPTAISKTSTFQDRIILADAETPLSARSSWNLGANIENILPLPRNNSSWEFGRSRFIVGTRHGIISLTCSSDKRSISRRTSDPLAVERPDAMTSSEEAIYIINDQTLLRITSDGKAKRHLLEDKASFIAWDNIYSELRLYTTNSCAIIDPTTGKTSYISAGTYPRSIATIKGTSFEISRGDDTLAQIGSEETSSSTDIEYSMIISPDSRKTRKHIQRLRIDAYGAFSGTISISNANLSVASDISLEASAPTTTLTIDGSILSPIDILIRDRSILSAKITIKGFAGADFIINKIFWI